jgi:hypothetical protein
MNTHRPPAAMAHLFPEVPAWAIAPFLGGEYLPVPFPAQRHATFVDASLPLGANDGCTINGRDAPCATWHVNITRQGESEVAAWWFRGVPSGLPFLTSTARIYRGGGMDTPTEQWRVPQERNTSFGPHAAEALRDLRARWEAITDRTVRAEIVFYWLGHDIPALAELGMACLAPDAVRARRSGGTHP